ncbi:hypothetical protein PVV74_11115 [Roseovarius sp. SK2]|jgi:hypothetical protein|uniref:hypothetical protein n=1 Tax=Roseovarius TaxID=74030 RepID=UPI00237ABFCE|nr:hypothetical protein [Roseovarius sp. SK2]MDD9726006.1 hypothetical protein [Roseovarius sp. SK2]
MTNAMVLTGIGIIPLKFVNLKMAVPKVSGRPLHYLDPACCWGAGFAGFAVDGAGLLLCLAGFGFDFGSAIGTSMVAGYYPRSGIHSFG